MFALHILDYTAAALQTIRYCTYTGAYRELRKCLKCMAFIEPVHKDAAGEASHVYLIKCFFAPSTSRFDKWDVIPMDGDGRTRARLPWTPTTGQRGPGSDVFCPIGPRCSRRLWDGFV